MAKISTKLGRNLFFALGLAALIVIAWCIGWDVIVAHVKKTGWWFFVIIGMWLPIYLINTLAFNTIIRDENPEHRVVPFLHVFKITLSGFALKSATPLGFIGGDPYKIMEFKPLLGVEKATSSVLLYTMTHISAHCIFWALSIVLAALFLPMKLSLSIILIATFISFVIVLIFLWRGYRKGLAVNAFSFFSHLPLLKKWVTPFREKYQKQLSGIDTQISYLYDARRKAFFTALSLELLARICNCLEVYVILKPVNIDVSLIDSIVVYAFMSLFTNILFFSPMQIGTREGGFALALKALSLPASLGVYVSLVTRVRELIWIGIGILLMKVKVNTKYLPIKSEQDEPVETAQKIVQ